MISIKIKLNSKLLYAPFVRAYLTHAYETGYWLIYSRGKDAWNQYITVQQVKDFIIHGHRLGTLATISTTYGGKLPYANIELVREGQFNDVGKVLEEEE